MRYRPSPLGVGCVVLAFGCLALGGCAKSAYTVAPVSGKVTLDGKPVPNLIVIFSPNRTSTDSANAGVGSSARTNAEGVFELVQQDATAQERGGGGQAPRDFLEAHAGKV